MAYGYAGGGSFKRYLPVANTAAITNGDMLKWDGAGQYVTPCGAGDVPCAVALEDSAKPTNDGDYNVLCELSKEAVFEYTTDDDSAVVAAARGKTCDVAGAQSIDIGASTDDCVEILDVDTFNKTVMVRLLFANSFAGIA